jgi:hypothetical protein
MLTNYGQRFGRQGYEYALRLMEDALALIEPDRQILEYQAVQNDIGNIYLHLADSFTDKEAIKHLERAEKAFKEAKRVTDPVERPFDWAMTGNNIANTIKLRARFERTEKKQKAMLLKAKDLYLQSLEKFTTGKYPSETAMVNRNLLACYGQLAALSTKDRTATRKLYSDALFVGMSAHAFYSKGSDHSAFFNTCIDLSIICMHIYQLGFDGSKGMEVVASGHLDTAESIADRQKSPVFWAMVQFNRMLVNYTVRSKENESDKKALLETSIKKIDEILIALDASPDSHIAFEAQEFRLLLTKELAAEPDSTAERQIAPQK